jgi:hypothetical protein
VLAAPLARSLPAVIQHLDVRHRSGRVRTCTLAPAPLRVVEQRIAHQRVAWERPDRLGDIRDATLWRCPLVTSIIVHRSFASERRYPYRARQALAAFAQAELVRQWFANPGNWPDAIRGLGG